MRHDTITRRRTTRSRRQRSQPWPILGWLAGLTVPGMRTAWRAFWQGVAHPRLVRGAVLLPLVLALLVVLAHLLLPRATSSEALGQRQSSPTPKPVLSVAERQPVLKRRLQASAQALVLAALNTVVLALFDFLRGRQCPANRCAA